MLNLIANSMDLARAALVEVLTHVAGDVAVPRDSHGSSVVGHLADTGHPTGVAGAPDARVSPSPG